MCWNTDLEDTIFEQTKYIKSLKKQINVLDDKIVKLTNNNPNNKNIKLPNAKYIDLIVTVTDNCSISSLKNPFN